MGFVLVPGILPHAIDIVVAILLGVTIAPVAVVGFDNTKVDKAVANLMIAVERALGKGPRMIRSSKHNGRLINWFRS